MYKNILLFIPLAVSSGSFAQQPADRLENSPLTKSSSPIPVEVFAGNKRMVFQMIVNKHFSPKSRFGFFNVTNFVGDYATTNQKNEYLS